MIATARRSESDSADVSHGRASMSSPSISKNIVGKLSAITGVQVMRAAPVGSNRAKKNSHRSENQWEQECAVGGSMHAGDDFPSDTPSRDSRSGLKAVNSRLFVREEFLNG